MKTGMVCRHSERLYTACGCLETETLPSYTEFDVMQCIEYSKALCVCFMFLIFCACVTVDKCICLEWDFTISSTLLYFFRFFGIRGYILAQAYQIRSELTFSLTLWYDSTTKTRKVLLRSDERWGKGSLVSLSQCIFLC